MLAILFLQPSEPDGAPRFTHFRNPSNSAAVRCPFTQSIQSVGVSTGQRLSTESRSPLMRRHKLHQRQSCPYSTSFTRTDACSSRHRANAISIGFIQSRKGLRPLYYVPYPESSPVSSHDREIVQRRKKEGCHAAFQNQKHMPKIQNPINRPSVREQCAES